MKSQISDLNLLLLYRSSSFGAEEDKAQLKRHMTGADWPVR